MPLQRPFHFVKMPPIKKASTVELDTKSLEAGLDAHFPGWKRNILGMQAYADLLGQYRDHWLAQYSSPEKKKKINTFLSLI